MLMQGFGSAVDIHGRQQPSGAAGILAQDQVAGGQDSPRTRRNVPQVADWSGNKHKAM
jgi:hypothetical protein